MRPTDILSTALLFSTASLAWPWPPSIRQASDAVDAVKRELAPLLARQGSSSSTSFDLSFSTTAQGNTATDSASSTGGSSGASTTGTSSGGSSSGTATGKNTGSSGTITATGKSTGTSGKSSTSSLPTFSDVLPEGGISMVTPNAYTTQYYKIGDYITFAWNYTSLSVTPSAIDVYATNALNSQLYPIATNLSVANATQNVIWDTGAYESAATVTLLTATYTLIVYDAAKDVSATASPGYLGTSDQFTFGMYVPQQRVDIQEWTCVTCNAALGSMERMTLGFMLGMATLTILSSLWFAGVAGLI